MERIVGGRSSGKTRKLLELAKEQNAIVLTRNPNAMRRKAEQYGIFGLQFYEYREGCLIDSTTPVVADEIEDFYCGNGRLIGYTLTDED